MTAAHLKQSFTYFKTLLQRAPRASVLALLLAGALSFFFYEARNVARISVLRQLTDWEMSTSFSYSVWWGVSFIMHALFYSILYTVLSQPAYFLWTEGRIPFWRPGFHILRKSARTFGMIFLLLRASFQIAIVPAVFIFLYYEYFSQNAPALTVYMYLTVAVVVSTIVFWRNAAFFSSLFAVSALDILPIQALYQIPAHLKLYQNQLAVEIFVIALASTLLAFGNSNLLTAHISWGDLLPIIEILVLWVALTAITHTILYAMSLSHDTKRQADPTAQLKEALLSFIKDRQRKQQRASQTYEEEVVVESYTVTNVTVEDEE